MQKLDTPPPLRNREIMNLIIKGNQHKNLLRLLKKNMEYINIGFKNKKTYFTEKAGKDLKKPLGSIDITNKKKRRVQVENIAERN